jgi:hypothetical protein
MRNWIFRAALFVSLVTPASIIDARQECKPIVGHFKASVVPPADCSVARPLVCTAGRVWGGLQADYAFTMRSVVHPADFSMPSINFFTGRSAITVKKGETLEALDAGTIDFQAGGFASLITITSGTGSYAGATGQLRSQACSIRRRHD